MDRSIASSLLGRLHRAQGDFYAGGDEDKLRLLLTQDIAWHVPGESAIAGDYRGLQDVLGYFALRRSLARNTMRMHPRELLVGDREYVASVTDGSATLGGVDHSWSTIGLYRVAGTRSPSAGCCPWTLWPSTSSGSRGLRSQPDRAQAFVRCSAAL